MKLPKKDLYGEVLGTCLLLVPGKAAAIAAILKRTIAGQPPDSLTVSLTFGLTLAAAVFLTRKFTCHLNPAITLNMALAGETPWKEVLPRMAAQLAGTVIGAGLLWGCYGSPGREVAHLGASLPVKPSSLWQVTLVEGLAALILCIVADMVLINSTMSVNGKAAALGVTLAICVTFAGSISGGAVNPAIALGPMIVSLTFSGVVSYVLAPLVAGALANFITRPLRSEPDEPAPLTVVRLADLPGYFPEIEPSSN